MKIKGMYRFLLRSVWLWMLMILLPGCSIQHSTSGLSHKGAKNEAFSSASQYALLPLLNVSQTPMAAERVETILAALLRAKGLSELHVYPTQSKTSILDILDEGKQYRLALDWASKENYRYLVTGSVEEWRYKSGLDGEPAVGITLKILDSTAKKVLWTATGARSGWGREAASMTAHELLTDLLDSLELDEHR